MRKQVAIQLARNPWLAAVLLVLFCARAIVPTGFMPGAGGLMLCSSYGPVVTGAATQQMAQGMPGMDMSGMDMPDMGTPDHSGGIDHTGNAPDHASVGICPFAAAATMIAAPHTVPVAMLAHLDSTSIEFPVPRFIPRGTIVPTRLPRGPPSSS